jgi:hypothetical protein
MKRTAAMKRTGFLKRAVPRRDPTPPQWQRYRGVCPMCLTVGWVEAHHIVPRRHLVRYGHGDKVWDTRNRLWAGACCHARHESAVRRFPREFVGKRAELFASEVGLGWVLDRLYGERVA